MISCIGQRHWHLAICLAGRETRQLGFGRSQSLWNRGDVATAAGRRAASRAGCCGVAGLPDRLLCPRAGPPSGLAPSVRAAGA